MSELAKSFGFIGPEERGCMFFAYFGFSIWQYFRTKRHNKEVLEESTEKSPVQDEDGFDAYNLSDKT